MHKLYSSVFAYLVGRLYLLRNSTLTAWDECLRLFYSKGIVAYTILFNGFEIALKLYRTVHESSSPSSRSNLVRRASDDALVLRK